MRTLPLKYGQCLAEKVKPKAFVVLQLNTPGTMCSNCGATMHDPVVIGLFVGHREINGSQYDVIQRLNPIVCASCGQSVLTLLIPCVIGEDRSLAAQLFGRIRTADEFEG